MQQVSQAWIDNQQKTLVNESFVEVSLSIADPDSVADASSEDNGAIYISDSSMLVSEVDKDVIPYITLEQNLWILDGNMRFIPETDYGDIGYVGDVVSDENGEFDSFIPTITISFTKVHENLIPGITIKWGTAYNEFAVDFNVTAYNGDTVVSEKTVIDNRAVTSVVEMDIVDYDRIIVRILKWCLPEHRPRIEEIFVGIEKVYSKRELVNYSHTQNVDPLSASLPKAEVTFAVDNRDNSYNPHNPVGLTKYLMERQEVRSRYAYKLDDGSVEWIPGGFFHLSEWESAQNGITASFRARDLLEYMNGTFYEGMYNPSGTSLYALAEQIMLKADLPLNADGSVKWHIDESLRSIYTVAPLPIDTLANCLQMIANASGCVLYQGRDGVLRLEPFAYTSSDYAISLFNSYRKSEMTLAKPLKQVNVEVFSYFTGDSVELYKGVMQLSGQTQLVLTYSEKAINPVAQVTGGTLVSAAYYTNACILTVEANGEVTIVINGTALKESRSDVIIFSDKTGEELTVSNPLITDRDMAAAVGTQAEGYLRNRRTLKSSWRVDPRVDALDLIKNINEYGENDMLLTSVTFDYSGAFHGTAEGRVVV